MRQMIRRRQKSSKRGRGDQEGGGSAANLSGLAEGHTVRVIAIRGAGPLDLEEKNGVSNALKYAAWRKGSLAGWGNKKKSH